MIILVYQPFNDAYAISDMNIEDVIKKKIDNYNLNYRYLNKYKVINFSQVDIINTFGRLLYENYNGYNITPNEIKINIPILDKEITFGSEFVLNGYWFEIVDEINRKYVSD